MGLTLATRRNHRSRKGGLPSCRRAAARQHWPLTSKTRRVAFPYSPSLLLLIELRSLQSSWSRLTDPSSSGRAGRGLLLAWVATVLVSAIDPRSSAVWAAETALPAFLVCWLVATARSFPLTSLSYAAIFSFLVLHQVGAHFTYPEVPLPAWIHDTGAVEPEPRAMRNPFDRIAHLSYGLLFTFPLREVAIRMVGARGFWRGAIPVCLVVTTSVFYEFIEWLFASTIGGVAGTLVLGMQDSQWDAHWDLLLASAGSVMAASAIALGEAITRRKARRARTAMPDTAL
jgi:putative membrane protein